MSFVRYENCIRPNLSLDTRWRKIHDADWSHWPSAFGPDQRTHAAGRFAPGGEGIVQIGVHSNNPSAFLLRGVVPQLDYRRNVTCRVQNHRPGQVGDFPGPQPGFKRQQDEDAIPDGIAASRNAVSYTHLRAHETR